VGERYAVVSCHVERLLDDDVWRRYRALVASRPGGFAIASLTRPPDPASETDRDRWLERAHELAALGPFGHHTHWGGPTTARPPASSPPPAERVAREAHWLRLNGLEPAYFCGGGWYLDADVASVLASFDYADCSATAFRHAYLPRGAHRAALDEPAWIALADGQRLLELPTTHSLGLLARALARSLPPTVHFYFHDFDLCDPRRRMAIKAALRVLGRVRRPSDLEEQGRGAAEARTVLWAGVAAG
jgi:hypothetical protein